MSTDSLYRISLKCLIRNSKDEVLVVKETGRSSWDLPGGGMEHSEGIQAAIARELREEVGFEGNFTYKIVGLDEPVQLLSRDVWQLRIILEISPEVMDFSVGADADEIQFIQPSAFSDSEHEAERKIYDYTHGLLTS